ncbi:MAG: hypothetical protein A3H28_12825 [Acidobacteria bacterium RIFCSPLOWO2_02_FULL_61_28]|nr:MAG: hypothetical protein A3H28_12825 [Acidobacteria bacterium RIFCSPLOWO2_02_FULL_61_28]
MFETSQQEQSSQAPKIILGAIAVVLVLFGVLYFGHLNQEQAATPGAAAEAPAAAAPAGAADPMRDLQILRSGLNRDRQTQTMGMWDVQIANRSRTIGYRDVQYTTNYYDAGGNVLATRGGTFPEPLEPTDQKTFTQLNDGLYPTGTTRFTIEIKGAQAATP